MQVKSGMRVKAKLPKNRRVIMQREPHRARQMGDISALLSAQQKFRRVHQNG